MVRIDVISGFLGAGKTTFIKRLLETHLKNEKVVLIENEYGDYCKDCGATIKKKQKFCVNCGKKL